jgi:hypothetical protein
MSKKMANSNRELNRGEILYLKGQEINKPLITWAEKEIVKKLEEYFEKIFPEPLFSNRFVSEVYRLQMGEEFRKEFVGTFSGLPADEVKKSVHSMLGYILYLMLMDTNLPVSLHKIETDDSGYIIYYFV